MAFTGTISMICGPMFSGKTSEMFRHVRRYMVAKKKCVIIKYSKDTRYGGMGEAATHDLIKMNSTPCTALNDVRAEAMQCDVIGIDEGQFFPDIVEFAEEMVCDCFSFLLFQICLLQLCVCCHQCLRIVRISSPLSISIDLLLIVFC